MTNFQDASRRDSGRDRRTACAAISLETRYFCCLNNRIKRERNNDGIRYRTAARAGKVALLLSEVQRGIIGDLAAGSPVGERQLPKSASLPTPRALQRLRAPTALPWCIASPTRRRRATGRQQLPALYRWSRSLGGRPAHNPAGDTPCPEVWQDGDLLSGARSWPAPDGRQPA